MKYKAAISRKALVLIAVLFVSATVLASAQPAEEPFLAELSGLLQQEGWTNDQIDQLRSEVQTLGPDPAENADPRAVALALSMTVATRPNELESRDTARLALELAAQSAQMRGLGFDDMTIARAALRRARESRDRVDASNRPSVSEAVQAETRRASAAQGRGRATGRGAAPRGVGRRNPPGLRDRDSPASDTPGRSNPPGGEE